MALRMSASSLGHSARASRAASFSRKGAFLTREKVRQKSASKRATSGAKTCRSATGRKPPSSSDESLCWLRLCTTRLWPSMRASCCTTVVLPVPVSPTSSTGSSIRTHDATRSISARACRVSANVPLPATPPLLRSRAEAPPREMGSRTRPTTSVPPPPSPASPPSPSPSSPPSPSPSPLPTSEPRSICICCVCDCICICCCGGGSIVRAGRTRWRW